MSRNESPTKKTPTMVCVGMRVTVEYHDWLCATADKVGVPLSDLFGKAMEAYARARKMDPPPKRRRSPRWSRRKTTDNAA